MSAKEEKKVLPLYQDTGYGFNIAHFFSLEAFKSALAYKPRPDDLFIVTYPKCGTTWVQNIVGCIFNEGKPFSSFLEFLCNTPFLEMAGAEAAETMKRPGAIKLHLPFRLTPWSPQAKYIFVARNPKDCVVSFFHHTKNIPGYNFQKGNFDDFFELFIDGNVDYGDYFDALLSWYEHRNDDNVLFITFEQLKKDTRTYVLKIAEFMGQKYKDMLTNDEDVLNNVIKYSSFDYMKQALNRQVAELAAMPKDFVLNHPDIPQGLKDILSFDTFDSDPNSVTFVRKGIVGDFKNYLSPEQNRRLEKKFWERTRNTEIPKLWKDIMNVGATAVVNPSAKPYTQIVDGFQLPGMFSADTFRSALKYKPWPDDVFIVTYPKCGTTWAQHIAVLIFRQGEPIKDQMEFFASTPFLEITGAEGAEKMPRPLPIKMHLPYHLTPLSDKAKYIYVTRNPKDCAVSYFHHMNNIPGHAFNGNFDEFFEFFITGNIDYGDYFDHLLGWYAHRNDPNVLFMTYEEMKERPEESIMKMASFINDEVYAEPLRQNPERLQNILKYSSFKYMKEVVNKGIEDMFSMSKEDILNSELPERMKKIFAESARPETGTEAPKKTEFVRKGIIGDWKNYFNEEQSKRLEEKYEERTKGTDIPNLWGKYM